MRLPSTNRLLSFMGDMEYWHHFRPSAGLGGQMIRPYPQDEDGEILEVSFLGELLHGYRREKIAA